MTTPTDLYLRLVQAGVELYADGDHLRWRAPEGLITAAVLADLKVHKLGLLMIIQNTPARQLEALLAQVEDPEIRDGLRYQFEERAAIVHFEGRQSVEAGERMALEEIRREVGAP